MSRDKNSIGGENIDNSWMGKVVVITIVIAIAIAAFFSWLS